MLYTYLMVPYTHWYLENASGPSKVRRLPAMYFSHLEEVVSHWIVARMLLLVLLLHPVRFVLRCSVKNVPLSLAPRPDFQYRCQIPASVAIVWCTPDCREAIVKHDHIPLITQLMCAENVVHAIHFQKLLDHLRPKCVSGSSWAQTELITLAVRVRPDQISHGSFMWYFSKPVDDLDLVNAVYARTQATVNAEDLIVDDARQTEVVEHVGEVVPDGRVPILSTALGVEAV